jgi:MFS family permease
MASLLTLLTSLAHDASNNFKQLLNVREEQVVVIDEDGKEKTVCMPAESPENPFRLLKMLSWTHWLHFFSGFLLLLVDSLDFNLLAVQTKKIALYFGTSKSVIASSITYTLLLRPVGALLFCVVSDYSGRRYPLFFAGLMLATLQIATIYCRSLSSFLGVRALFGIAMGSIYGSSAAMAMDNCPTRARGLVSGSELCKEAEAICKRPSLTESFYLLLPVLASYGAVAYVVAAFMNLEAGSDPLSWKKTFWISSGLTFAAAFIRLAVPEAQQFKDLKEKSEHAPSGMKKVKAFISDFNTAMKVSWKRFFYMIVLVTSIIFLIHAFVSEESKARALNILLIRFDAH